MDSTKLPALSLSSHSSLTNDGGILQRITYPCGCEALGKAPMPLNCPTHHENAFVVPGVFISGNTLNATVVYTGDPASPAKKTTIILNVILDESGSMAHVREKTVSALNEYVNGLRSDPNADYLVTLTKFDAAASEPTCRVMYRLKPLSEVVDLTLADYTPRGTTPLFDAIGETVRQVETDVAGRPVLTVIITDGQENASREFTKGAITALIKSKQDSGNWTFVYLGADQDAWAAASTIGLFAGNVQSFTSSDMKGQMNRMSDYTRAYSSSTNSGMMSTGQFFDGSGTSLKPHSSSYAGTVSELAQKAGKARMSGLSEADRSALGKKAAYARWSKSNP